METPASDSSTHLGKPITVYGDGDQTKSFTHVWHVANGITGMTSGARVEGGIYNVGNDKEVTINDPAEKVKKMTGSASPIERVPYEKAYGRGFEDMRQRCPNITKIRKLIGFGI